MQIEFKTYDDKDADNHYHGFQQDVYIGVQKRIITHRANWIHGDIFGYSEWISAVGTGGEIVFYIK